MGSRWQCVSSYKLVDYGNNKLVKPSGMKTEQKDIVTESMEYWNYFDQVSQDT